MSDSVSFYQHFLQLSTMVIDHIGITLFAKHIGRISRMIISSSFDIISKKHFLSHVSKLNSLGR